MPPSPITALTDTRVLQALVNKRIKKYTALTSLLFPESTRETLFTEFAQVDVLDGTYGMAPFAKIGQKAYIVDSLNGTSYTVETPFINIQRPLQYSTNFAKRQAQQGVFITSDQNVAHVRKAIEQDVDYMNNLVDNRIEWMVAYILRGEINYSEEGHDSFIINSGKPSANTFTVSALWNGGSAVPLEDIFQAKLIVANRRGPAPNIAVCGANAGAALRALVETDKIPTVKTTSGVDSVARANLLSRIEENGMVFIGRFGDVDFFEYTGKFQPDTGGADEPLIRDDYIEFFSTGDRSVGERQLLFGSMPDLAIIMRDEHVTQRHLTSVPPKEDQGSFKGIMKSRPFPHLRRPDWQVSMKVV